MPLSEPCIPVLAFKWLYTALSMLHLLVCTQRVFFLLALTTTLFFPDLLFILPASLLS